MDDVCKKPHHKSKGVHELCCTAVCYSGRCHGNQGSPMQGSQWGYMTDFCFQAGCVGYSKVCANNCDAAKLPRCIRDVAGSVQTTAEANQRLQHFPSSAITVATELRTSLAGATGRLTGTMEHVNISDTMSEFRCSKSCMALLSQKIAQAKSHDCIRYDSICVYAAKAESISLGLPLRH